MKTLIGLVCLLGLIAFVVLIFFAASKDPHDYDIEYIPRWDFNLNTVIMDPNFVHRKDCRFCKTNLVVK